jgi:aminoglycoside/choline kinase family phosphotransferase
LSRLEALLSWVNQTHSVEAGALTPASTDASFRRYFRFTQQNSTFIVMDAPPQHEDCRPFAAISRLFEQAGVHVPKVLREDFNQGFLLLTDLGSTTYLDALHPSVNGADPLYRDAFRTLVTLQRASRPGVLPEYSEELLRREVALFPDWYVACHCGITLSTQQLQVLNTTVDVVMRNVLAQPRVFVHRDYHSRNLMVSTPNPGVLDFQDAVYGPITYDAVSLLKDAYIHWEEEQRLDWLVRYWEAARKAGLPVADDIGTFYRDYEWMGVQRHLKVMGIFARLCHRDGKTGYLNDIPLVWRYLREACGRYRELQPLANLLDQLSNTPVQEGYTF